MSLVSQDLALVMLGHNVGYEVPILRNTEVFSLVIIGFP